MWLWSIALQSPRTVNTHTHTLHSSKCLIESSDLTKTGTLLQSKDQANIVILINWYTFNRISSNPASHLKCSSVSDFKNQIYVTDTQPLYSAITEPLQQMNSDLGSGAASCPAVWVQSLGCIDRGINCVARTHLKSDTWQACIFLRANKQKHTVGRLPIKCQVDASQVHCLIRVQIIDESQIIRVHHWPK